MATTKSQGGAKRKFVRLNLQLPGELKALLDQQATQLHTTTPKLARTFLRQGLDTLKQQELDQYLIAGYQYLANENQRLLKEFRTVDLENWEDEETHDA